MLDVVRASYPRKERFREWSPEKKEDNRPRQDRHTKKSGGGGETPRWDALRHELSWRGQLIKHFKAEAPNQEAILAAFEESRWAEVIDIALEPGRATPKARLHDTIRNLNRSVRPWLHFWQEGSGTRVGWSAGVDRTPTLPHF